MTEKNFQDEKNREYIESIIAKFNANKEDPTLSESEKTLLAMVLAAENQIAESKNELFELQAKVNHLQSQSLAFVDSLVALKNLEKAEE